MVKLGYSVLQPPRVTDTTQRPASISSQILTTTTAKGMSSVWEQDQFLHQSDCSEIFEKLL